MSKNVSTLERSRVDKIWEEKKTDHKKLQGLNNWRHGQEESITAFWLL